MKSVYLYFIRFVPPRNATAVDVAEIDETSIDFHIPFAMSIYEQRQRNDKKTTQTKGKQINSNVNTKDDNELHSKPKGHLNGIAFHEKQAKN